MRARMPGGVQALQPVHAGALAGVMNFLHNRVCKRHWRPREGASKVRATFFRHLPFGHLQASSA
jgi:hypothetical protein